MKKLLKLLNEYEWYTDIPTWTLSWANEPLYWWWTAYASAYLIPSKKYWFIERLVEQNKIDDSKVWNSDMLSVQYHDLVNDYKYEWLIMILSISENPISDLISYLK